MLHKFDSWQDEYSERSNLHAKLSEQAASDRVFFLNTGTPAEKRAFKVRNVEYVCIFSTEGGLSADMLTILLYRSLNTGSPYNVPAGWGGINLEKVIAHQNKENEEIEQRNTERLERKLAEAAKE